MGAVETKTKLIDIVELQQLRRTMTLVQLASYYNVTTSALWKWSQRHNVIMKRMTDDELAESIMTMTPKQIAIEYNVNLFSVYKRLKRMNINPKQKGQR